MRKCKILVNSQTIKDDYGTDPKMVISAEVEDELGDVIPNCSIEVSKKIHDLFTLRQNQVVEIFTGETGTDRVFYGYIMDIVNEGGTTKIEASAETINLIRRNVNRIYTSDEAHLGKNELIVKDLIERAGLTAQVETPTDENIIDEFKCIHAEIFERILSLMKAVDYQLRYDPATRIVHYEPRGFIDNSTTLQTKNQIAGLPKWEETTDGLINDLRIDGATTETEITETGTIGTTSGWQTDGILLTKTPNIVELIVDGTQRQGGSKDGSSGHYFWVDRENKKIMPATGTSFSEDVAIVNYSWSAPAPVQDFRQDSIDIYGRFDEVLSFNDISSVADAEARIEKLLDARSEPFVIGNIRIKTDVLLGEYVTVVDNLSTPNVNRKFVVTKIINKYPSPFLDIQVGDKEWKLEDDVIEIENRIKRLEENFIRNQDLLLQLIRLGDNEDTNAEFAQERYIKIYEKNIGGDVGIYGNADFGVYGGSKYGSEADQSFILGKSKLGLNALGSKTSEEVIKVVQSFGDYVETFYDEDFKDTGNWNGTYADAEEDISTYISYREKNVLTATIIANYTGDLTFYLDNGNGWEEATGTHTFASSGTSLRWKVVSTGNSELTKLEITY